MLRVVLRAKDLGREDFQVLEDGRLQQVTFFQPCQLPLALALLLDTSASMRPHLGVAVSSDT